MYEMMFYGGLVSFAVGLIISIALFVKNDVGKMIGDLTGYNAKKAMKELQKKKEEKRPSEKPQEEQKQEKDKDKKEKRQPRRTTLGKTDVLPVSPERQEQPLQQAQDRLASEEDSSILVEEKEDSILAEEKQETVDVSGVFEMEEDVTVFGGDVVTQMPTTVLSGKISFKNVEAVPEKEDFSKDVTRVLQGGFKGTHILSNGINAFASDDEIEELLVENQELSHDMSENDGFVEKNEDVSDDATDLLYDDSMEETTVLADELQN